MMNSLVQKLNRWKQMLSYFGTILRGLLRIFAAVDSCENDLSGNLVIVQQMMKGSDIGFKEKRAKLFNEMGKGFTLHCGESIESYYNMVGVGGNSLDSMQAEYWVQNGIMQLQNVEGIREMGHLARNCTVRPRRKDATYLQTQLLIALKRRSQESTHSGRIRWTLPTAQEKMKLMNLLLKLKTLELEIEVSLESSCRSRQTLVRPEGHSLDLEVAFRRNSVLSENLMVLICCQGNVHKPLHHQFLSILPCIAKILLWASILHTPTVMVMAYDLISHLNFDTSMSLPKTTCLASLQNSTSSEAHLFVPHGSKEKEKGVSTHPNQFQIIREYTFVNMDLCWSPMRIACIKWKAILLSSSYKNRNWGTDSKIIILKSIPLIVLDLSQGSSVRTPQQNGVVERRNSMDVSVAARTMLIFSRAPLFLWAEQLLLRRYPKTLICEDIWKLGANGDIGFFHWFILLNVFDIKAVKKRGTMHDFWTNQFRTPILSYAPSTIQLKNQSEGCGELDIQEHRSAIQTEQLLINVPKCYVSLDLRLPLEQVIGETLLDVLTEESTLIRWYAKEECTWSVTQPEVSSMLIHPKPCLQSKREGTIGVKQAQGPWDIVNVLVYVTHGYQAKPTEEEAHTRRFKRIFVISEEPLIRANKLVSWSSKETRLLRLSTAKQNMWFYTVCVPKSFWMRTQLTVYGFLFKMIPIYCVRKSAMSISGNGSNTQEQTTSDCRTDFIKETWKKGTNDTVFCQGGYTLLPNWRHSYPKLFQLERIFNYLVRALVISFHDPSQNGGITRNTPLDRVEVLGFHAVAVLVQVESDFKTHAQSQSDHPIHYKFCTVAGMRLLLSREIANASRKWRRPLATPWKETFVFVFTKLSWSSCVPFLLSLVVRGGLMRTKPYSSAALARMSLRSHET
ncbi:hypothetical protein Tco_1030329 [Tanacetum coccineum]|uniref:Uncharacterized protein n=1 Tax=Tanacetum coccineum TaxID=301880 RepID=A0ABQ5G745_9ASTR